MLRRIALIVVVTAGLGLAPRPVASAELDSALSVSDAATLRELELHEHAAAPGARQSFALGRMLAPHIAVAPSDNAALFALPALAPLRAAIDQAFESYRSQRHAAEPQLAIGVGDGHDVRLFDRELLVSAQTRFALAGIVNRMDRAFRAPESCGEVRLIYRLRRSTVSATPDAPSPLLPMTLNLVLRAAPSGDGDALQRCATVARRWLDVATQPRDGIAQAARLVGPDGPLQALTPQAIDRIEINLQIAHTSQQADRAARADYLLASFRYHSDRDRFEPAPMENQIDRDRLRADEKLARAFKRWLLAPAQLTALDRGTILIPDDYLATSAIAPTPAGFAPSQRQPAFGLAGAGEGGPAVIDDAEIVAALREAAAQGVAFDVIRSPAGFVRRLGDVTCVGCHQTRGIGGFHVPGVDWSAATGVAPVSASPHFIGDQARRRDILVALSEGRAPDFARGFADRPTVRGGVAAESAGGWGAHCARPMADGQTDPSFTEWRCADGLSCERVGEGGATAPIGMCFVAPR